MQRELDNDRVLRLLAHFLHGAGRSYRFNQLVSILNHGTDYFYEEPAATCKRLEALVSEMVGDLSETDRVER